MTVHNYFRSILQYSFIIIIYTYGIWYGITDVFSSFLPLGLIPASIIIIMVQMFKVPAPPKGSVEKIVGKDFFADPDNVGMKMMAHRGAGLDAPENSLVAFDMCKQKGCMYIEFDVQLSKDGMPIVFHDETLERMTGINKPVAECTYEELKKVDISKMHPYRDKFTGTKIPTLKEAVEQLLEANQIMFIDIKNNDSRMVKIITDMFHIYPDLINRAVVTSFFPVLIYKIRRINPNIVCSLAYRPYYFSHSSYSYLQGVGPRRAKAWYRHVLYVIVDAFLTWCLPHITYYMLGLSILLVHKDAVCPKTIQDWHCRGVRVCVWTVNQPPDKQYFARSLKCSYLTDTLTGESTTHLKTDSNGQVYL